MSVHEGVLGMQFLYATLSTDATLTSFAPGGVYRGIAPPATPTPFVIIGLQAGTSSNTMNAVRLMMVILFQAKAVGPASNMAALANAASRIDTLLKRTSGTVPGTGTILACYGESTLFLDEIINGELWSSVGGLYRMEIQAV